MRFEEIYQEYGQKIYRLCMSYCNDEDWAKDLMQDTFMQVYLNLKKFRNEASIGTWVYRIATNICLRQMDKNSKMKMSNDKIPELKVEFQGEDDQIKLLKRCIGELEKTERLMITMMLDGLKYQEIANVLGISEGNVRVKIHRIKKTLTKKFKAYERV